MQNIAERIIARHFADAKLERVTDARYLFAMSMPSRGKRPKPRCGYFVVAEGDGLGVLDRTAFRAIVAEARAHGMTGDLHVFARICTYAGPRLHVYQDI